MFITKEEMDGLRDSFSRIQGLVVDLAEDRSRHTLLCLLGDLQMEINNMMKVSCDIAKAYMPPQEVKEDGTVVGGVEVDVVTQIEELINES
jgi:hypothetical protein